MTAQPLDDSRFSDRELLGVLAERVGNVKETFDEFRDETRGNFQAAKEATAELKVEMKSDTLAIRSEMRDGFQRHEERITSLEKDRDTTKGGFGAAKWIWGAAVAAAGVVGGMLGKAS